MSDDLQKRIDELERRIADLERRPVYIPVPQLVRLSNLTTTEVRALLACLAERDAEIERLRADRSLLLNGMRRAVTAVAAAAELDADFDLDSQALDKLLTRFADDAARGKE